MELTLLLAVLATIAFWAGFRAPPHHWQYLSQAAFFGFLALVLFTGYFTWREYRSVSELTRLIEPVPEITGGTYVPTPGEVQTIARGLATVPGRGRFGTTQEQRRELAEDTEQFDDRYWSLETPIAAEDVVEFYRDSQNARDWTLVTDEPPFLMLERPGETLTIFVQEDWKSANTKVWYIYSVAR
jgi:hypothetical protein